MALSNDQITANNFADFYQMILPYLNGGGMGMKLLWENSDPSSNFEAQRISLSSADYDLLLLIALNVKITSSEPHRQALSVISPKGQGFMLSWSAYGNNQVYSRVRQFYYVDDTHIDVGDNQQNGTNNNTDAIPYRIYGIKVYNRDVQSDYEIIDGTIDSIGANAKKTITLSPTIPTGKKVIGWSMYTVDSDLQTYMQYYGGDYILCVKNIGNSAMTNKDYRVVFIYGQ